MSELPPNVTAVTDRHGKVRYRFRRKGYASAYLHGEPGTAEFHRSYAAIIDGGPAKPKSVSSPQKVEPRSLDDLLHRVKAGTRWKKKADSTKLVQGRILERFMDRRGKSGRRFGERPVRDVTVAWLDTILAGMSDTPGAANVLRKNISGLMDYAGKLGWRSDNPVRLTDSYADGDGFTPWSEEDIAAYRNAHPLGTMARLVIEIVLNTAARRSNVATLTRDDLQDGRITVAHVKDNNVSNIEVSPTTRAALDALPVTPIKHLVVTQFGKPFTVAGLGNRMRKWCDEAGLPDRSMHGLRKAVARRVAESGGTDAEGQAITGHKKSDTFVYYRASANRSALADTAMSNVVSTFDAQPNTGDEI